MSLNLPAKVNKFPITSIIKISLHIPAHFYLTKPVGTINFEKYAHTTPKFVALPDRCFPNSTAFLPITNRCWGYTVKIYII